MYISLSYFGLYSFAELIFLRFIKPNPYVPTGLQNVVNKNALLFGLIPGSLMPNAHNP